MTDATRGAAAHAASTTPTTTPTIGWVVDVQHDFMVPPERGGRLYVRDLFAAGDVGAELARPAIERAVAWMHARCAAVVYTGDWHRLGDREIDPVAPDATRATYPPHCMGLSDDPAERAGAALLPGIAPADPVVLERDATAADAAAAVRAMGVGGSADARRAAFVRKYEFSVFEGNPAADAFVQALVAAVGQEAEFVVCGVATDVCVKAAVEGLLARGHRVAVVTDACWGLGLESGALLFARWAAQGARLTTTDALDG
jgi:nicotinamidase-related amidase